MVSILMIGPSKWFDYLVASTFSFAYMGEHPKVKLELTIIQDSGDFS